MSKTMRAIMCREPFDYRLEEGTDASGRVPVKLLLR